MNYKEGRDIAFRALETVKTTELFFVEIIDIFPLLLHLSRFHLVEKYNDKTYEVKDSLDEDNNLFGAELFENNNLFDKVFYSFNSKLSEFKRQYSIQYKELMSLLSVIPEEWYKNYYSELFDEILDIISSYGVRRSFHTSKQPKEISLLIKEISGYKKGDSVYNPFAGLMSYGIEMDIKDNIVFQESNRTTWALGVLRLMAYDNDSSKCYCDNPISNWGIKLQKNDESDNLYDFIISTPPINVKIDKLVSNIDPSKKINTVDNFLIEKGLSSLTKKGKLIGVFTNKIMSEGGLTEQIRKYAVDNDLLDTVITLPQNLFDNTMIPVVILIFSMKKEKDQHIKMVNGTSFFQKKGRINVLQYKNLLKVIDGKDSNLLKYVENKEIIENDYIIDPFICLKEKEIVPEGFKSAKLRNLAKIYDGQKVGETGVKGKVVNIGDLLSERFDWKIDMNNLSSKEVKNNYLKITFPVLLLSKIRTLKPSFCNASEDEPIYIGSNLLPLIVDKTKLYIPYLISELSLKSSDLIKGNFIPNIKTCDILKILIIYPLNLCQQESLFNREKHNADEAKLKENKLLYLLDEKKKEFVEELKIRKHDMSQYLGAISNNVSALDKYLKKKGYDEELISNVRNIPISQHMDKLRNSIEKMGYLLKNLTEDEQFGIPEKLDLDKKLSSLKDGLNYKVEYIFDIGLPEDDIENEDISNIPYVSIAERDFDRIVDNIISNAIKHGFIDSNRFNYILQIKLSYDEENELYVIEFRNNGVAMPKGLDTHRYGIKGEKGGLTASTGIGGYLVKNTLEHYNGICEIVSDKGSLFPVNIIIKLPKID